MNRRDCSSRAGEEARQLDLLGARRPHGDRRRRQCVRGGNGQPGGQGDEPQGRAAAERLDDEAADEVGDDEGDRPPQPHATVVETLGADPADRHRLDQRQHGPVGEQEGDADEQDGQVAGDEAQAGDHGQRAPGQRHDHGPVVAQPIGQQPDGRGDEKADEQRCGGDSRNLQRIKAAGVEPHREIRNDNTIGEEQRAEEQRDAHPEQTRRRAVAEKIGERLHAWCPAARSEPHNPPSRRSTGCAGGWEKGRCDAHKKKPARMVRTGSSAKSGGAPNRRSDAPPGARKRCRSIALPEFVTEGRAGRKWSKQYSETVDASVPQG